MVASVVLTNWGNRVAQVVRARRVSGAAVTGEAARHSPPRLGLLRAEPNVAMTSTSPVRYIHATEDDYGVSPGVKVQLL